MAARKSLSHDLTARQNIQTSQLLNRLNKHANGKVDMTPTQVKAAEILLRKSLPDLSAVTLAGDPENPIHSKATLDASGLTNEQLRALASIPVRSG